jgi:hydrogenase nickel incorporation protein HypA/HybF
VHELSLADAIVTIALDHAQGRRVTAVDVRIGYLRQVVPDALAFAFELVTTGTAAEGAALHVVHVPARFACVRCQTVSDAEGFPLSCSSCGGVDGCVVAGDELLVDSIELEDVAIPVAGGR